MEHKEWANEQIPEDMKICLILLKFPRKHSMNQNPVCGTLLGTVIPESKNGGWGVYRE